MNKDSRSNKGNIKEIRLAGGNGFPIREFELRWFCPNPTICMIAKRGSGKSYLCQKILEHHSYLPGGLIISRTDKMSSFYGKFFPDLFIHYRFSSEVLEQVLDRQMNMIDKAVAKYKKGKKTDPRAFLIMDDCLADKKAWINDEHIMEVFYNGRHYQLLFILTMQAPLGIGPELRNNFDYIFLLANDFINEQNKLYDHYAGVFPSRDIFRQVFTQVTRDYGALVLVNKNTGHNLLDKVFYYRVDKLENKEIGCQQFRDFHDRNYDPNWQHRKKEFDPSKFLPKSKKGCKIVVQKI